MMQRGDDTAASPPDTKRLAAAVFVAVAIGLVTVAVSLLRFEELSEVLRTANPTQSADAAANILWSRIGVAAGVAVIWPLLLRRLGRGRVKTYRRIQRSSVVAAAALVGVQFLDTSPFWLHMLQSAQAAAQLGIMATTLTPSLRRWYLQHCVVPIRTGTWRPILLLSFLSPFIAEVSIGHVPFSVVGMLTLVFIAPIYSAGAVLIREVARRTGGGWPTILLLGVCFCLIEEGLGLRSLFSPTIYDGLGPALGARVDGINGVYLLLQLVNHIVWSIAAPIALTEIAFRNQGGIPWLRRRGLIVTSVVYGGGAALTVLIQLQSDPGFRAPTSMLIGTATLTVALVGLAVSVRQPVGRSNLTSASLPSPILLFIYGFGCAAAFLGVLYIPGRHHLGITQGPSVLILITIALGLIAVFWLLVSRWIGSKNCTDQHVLALVGGSVLGHTAIWGSQLPGSSAWQMWFGVSTLAVGTAAALVVGERLLNNRKAASAATPNRS